MKITVDNKQITVTPSQVIYPEFIGSSEASMVLASGNMKVCSRCNLEKSTKDFWRDKGAGDGLYLHCKACAAALNSDWHKANLPHRAAYQRLYYAIHKDEIANTTAGNLAHRAELLRARRIKNHHTRASALLGCARVRAEKRGLPFTLTKQWVLDRLVAGVCEKTGLPFYTEAVKHHQRTPSIDRNIPALGYTPENCTLVIWGYNTAKGKWTDADVLAMARALVAMADGEEIAA